MNEGRDAKAAGCRFTNGERGPEPDALIAFSRRKEREESKRGDRRERSAQPCRGGADLWALLLREQLRCRHPRMLLRMPVVERAFVLRTPNKDGQRQHRNRRYREGEDWFSCAELNHRFCGEEGARAESVTGRQAPVTNRLCWPGSEPAVKIRLTL